SVVTICSTSERLVIHCRHHSNSVRQGAHWLQFLRALSNVACGFEQLRNAPLYAAWHPRRDTERVELRGYISVEGARESEPSAQTNVNEMLDCPEGRCVRTHRTWHPNVRNGEP